MDLHAREVTAVTRDARGRLVALCNPGEPWSPVSAALAIRQIRAGVRSYMTVRESNTSGIAVVNRRLGPYLRTVADIDGERADNLKKLPRTGSAQDFTGSFDGVIQVDQPSVAAAVRALHATQVFPHRVNVIAPTRVGVLCVGAPQMGFSPVEIEAVVEARAPVMAFVDTSFMLWSRSADDVSDSGECACGAVHVPVRCEAVLEGDDTLTLAADWSAATAADVRIDTQGLDDDAVSRARQMVLDWAHHAGGRYPLPQLARAGDPVGLQLRFVEGVAGSAVAQVGIHAETSTRHEFPRPSGDAVRVAMASAWIVRQVLDALRTQWGDLPEPHGTAKIDLGNGATLTALDVEIAAGALSLVGRLISGPTHAMFTLTIGVEGAVQGSWNAGAPSGAQGAAWRTDGETVDVQIEDLLSQVGDFLSAGAIRKAITDGVRAAVASGPDGGLAGVLSQATLGAFASAGTAAPVDIGVQVAEAGLTRFGLLMRGHLQTKPPADVVASLRALPLTANWWLLNAMDSWSPGDRLTRVLIDFGDGSTLELHGDTLALAIPHEYAPGRWTAAVTVVDSTGRSARASAEVEVAGVAQPA